MPSNGYHNHVLLWGIVHCNTNAGNRFIPPNVHNHPSLLIGSGMSISGTYAALVKHCKLHDIERTFIKKDIENEFSIRGEHKILDSTNLNSYLKERLDRDPSLCFNVDINDDGTLDKVFFVMEVAVELLASTPSKIVVLDTKHGTNRFGLKLGCFNTSDKMKKHVC